MSLFDLIKSRIKESGPLSIADYMALALTHPEYGYYMRRDPLGAGGDFTTAPEISQIFGELIGLWLAHQWEKQGKPEAIFVELGPGRGTLMADALRAAKKIQGFHDALSLHLIEASPLLKQKQWAQLANKHPRIAWHETMEDLPEAPLFLIANEFFDALPIRQFLGEGEWKERRVGIENDRLIFVMADAAEQYAANNGRAASSASPPCNDVIKESCPPALAIAAQIDRRIASHGGAALIIDYGYEGNAGDTLQAVKNHTFHPVLETPGEADITAHVDFGALKSAVSRCQAYGPVAQGKFLMKIGAGQRAQNLCLSASEEQGKAIVSGLNRLAAPEEMGELFKALALLPKNQARPEGF